MIPFAVPGVSFGAVKELEDIKIADNKSIRIIIDDKRTFTGYHPAIYSRNSADAEVKLRRIREQDGVIDELWIDCALALDDDDGIERIVALMWYWYKETFYPLKVKAIYILDDMVGLTESITKEFQDMNYSCRIVVPHDL